jgi:outer membrane protein assembly factor BamB
MNANLTSTEDCNPQPSLPPEKCSPWILFAMPVGVGIALGLVISIVKSLQEIDTRSIYLGLDGMRLPIGFALAAFALTTAIVLYVRPKLRHLAIAIVGLILAAFGATQFVRIESFYGNMIPRITWRWKPTAEQEIQSYLVSTAKSRNADAVHDLFVPTEHDFPGFLGPNRDATVTNVQLSSDWVAQPPRLLWKHPVGLGWSSFATMGKVAIDLEQRGDSECVICYNMLSGEEIWCYADNSRFADEHGDGPRSTPTIYKDRVYAMGANGTLVCLDLQTGKLIWRRSTLEDPAKQNLLWGMSGSPLIYDDFVVVTPGAGEGSSAIAYSLDNGREVWRSGDDPAAYSSPIEVTLCGERQILSFNGAGLRSYAIDGTPIWLQPWLTQGESQRVNVAQPVVVSPAVMRENNEKSDRFGHVLISSGYDNGTALLKVTRNATDNWTVETVWLSKNLKSKMSNFVVCGTFIYGLDNGILTCLNLKDGQRRWKRGRYGHGQLLVVNDKLLIQAESGDIALVALNPNQHNELATMKGLESKTWNHVALSGSILIVRNDREAAAYELPTE